MSSEMVRLSDWNAGFNAALKYIVAEGRANGLLEYGCEEWKHYSNRRMGFQRWQSFWRFVADLGGLRSWMLRRAERAERRKLWRELDRARSRAMRAHLQGRHA